MIEIAGGGLIAPVRGALPAAFLDHTPAAGPVAAMSNYRHD